MYFTHILQEIPTTQAHGIILRLNVLYANHVKNNARAHNTNYIYNQKVNKYCATVIASAKLYYFDRLQQYLDTPVHLNLNIKKLTLSMTATHIQLTQEQSFLQLHHVMQQ